jgi:hypothetical protein
MSARILTAALDYAGHDWAVFPARPDRKCSYKSAKYSNGANWGATSDPAEVLRDFIHWPDARIGIPCAVNGIVVIETDTPEGHGIDGASSLAQLEAEHGSLPATLMACSPSGSIHRYFRHPGDGIKIRNRASELGAGVDVRGDGGMVIAPPSVNLDGRRYRWINKLPIAAMPAWLVELTREKPRTISQRAVAAISNTKRRCVFDAPSNYGVAALQYEIDNIHQAEVGHRNAVLNKAGFALGQLVAIGLLDEAEVARLLFEAAASWGNPNKDRDVIRYAIRAGLQHPRQVPR